MPPRLRLPYLQNSNGLVLNLLLELWRPAGLRNDLHIRPGHPAIDDLLLLAESPNEFCWTAAAVVSHQQVVPEAHPPVLNGRAVDALGVILGPTIHPPPNHLPFLRGDWWIGAEVVVIQLLPL